MHCCEIPTMSIKLVNEYPTMHCLSGFSDILSPGDQVGTQIKGLTEYFWELCFKIALWVYYSWYFLFTLPFIIQFSRHPCPIIKITGLAKTFVTLKLTRPIFLCQNCAYGFKTYMALLAKFADQWFTNLYRIQFLGAFLDCSKLPGFPDVAVITHKL